MAAKRKCEEGAGAIDDTHISYGTLLKMIKIVLSLIKAQLF